MVEILNAKNYATSGRRADKKYLMESVAKVDRGLLQYTRYADHDLNSFSRGRGIALEQKYHLRRAARASMISTLEAADENLRFTRFLKLPAEIRFLVYQYSMRSIGIIEAAKPPYQMPALPALSQVSRTLRAESLEAFYKTQQFPLCVRPEPHGNRYDFSWIPTISSATHVFLRCTNEHDLRSIRHFEMSFGTSMSTLKFSHAYTTVRFCNRTKSMTVLADLALDHVPMTPEHMHRFFTDLDSRKSLLNERNIILERHLRDLASSTGSFTGRQIYACCKAIQSDFIELKAQPGSHYDLPVHVSIDIV